MPVRSGLGSASPRTVMSSACRRAGAWPCATTSPQPMIPTRIATLTTLPSCLVGRTGPLGLKCWGQLPGPRAPADLELEGRGLPVGSQPFQQLRHPLLVVAGDDQVRGG